MSQSIVLFSCDLNKWNGDSQKATMTFYFHFDSQNYNCQLDVQLNNFEQSWSKLIGQLKETINETSNADGSELKDEAVIKAGLSAYFEKIRREIGNGRNGKKHGKSSISRYNLFYLKDPELELLNDDEKFLAYLDIIDRKAKKDQYSQIGSYIDKALEIKKNDPELLRYQANFLLASNKTEDALNCLKEYLKVNKKDVVVQTQLAKLYDKLEDYKNADKMYDQIIKNDPENLNAIMRKAQIMYYNGDDFLSELDKIYKLDPTFLKEFLKKDWDYHLPEQKKDLNPVRAAVYFGYDRAMDIAPYAFNREIPAYIDMKSANVMFSKQELDQWFKIINKYDINEYGFELYPEKM